MADLIESSLIELIANLRRGEISSRELTETYLERIGRLEPRLHAFLSMTPEKALAQADQADLALNAVRKKPGLPLPALLGVPIAVKDVLCVADVRCTCGSRILENFVPPYSATAVKRLQEAGVVILGKTNTD